MTPAFRIRPAAAADLPQVEQTLSAADLPLDGLREQFGDGYAVALSGDRLIGVEGIEVYGTDGLLRSAAVAPDWRGRGVGDALTRDRIAW
ncbi:MAG: GNAT family N-acetyltransferase, partial [Gemmatimonadaceae bacterium]|nr:GNAT family N-acetyltransferase [Gemmatimonadaceae bacterium]